MIYRLPHPEESLDQGDIIDGCPLVSLVHFDAAQPATIQTQHAFHRIIVLTQTCDLANLKAPEIVTAIVWNAEDLVQQQLLKAAEVRGPIRSGRVYGWYFLPRSDSYGLPESIVDRRQLHMVRLDYLLALCARGQRRARFQPLYREHLAKHFADTYSRIGLPEPYATE